MLIIKILFYFYQKGKNLLGGRGLTKYSFVRKVKNYSFSHLQTDYAEVFDLLKQQKFIVCTVFTPNILTVLPDDFEPESGDYIAIKNIDEFLERSNYKLSH